MRLIDADEFINELSQLYAYAGWDKRDIHFSLSDVACNLEMMPVFNVVLDFQAETPKHGHWIEANDISSSPFDAMKRCLCSECREWGVVTNYCPNCGAKMDEAAK